jgi:SdpI/YfhL protein family
MMLRQHRTQIVLAAGFLLSVFGSSTLFRPPAAYDTAPVLQQLLILFALPTAATAVYVVIRVLQRRQGMLVDGLPSDPAIHTIVFWILLFLVGLHAVVLGVLIDVQGIRPMALRTVMLFLGVTLVAVGNVLPQMRPNMALGIRTSRSLNSRSFWLRIHRAGGYMCVGIGVILMSSSVLLSAQSLGPAAGALAVTGMRAFSVWYRKLSRSGV